MPILICSPFNVALLTSLQPEAAPPVPGVQMLTEDSQDLLTEDSIELFTEG
jgi:hypothetical protein